MILWQAVHCAFWPLKRLVRPLGAFSIGYEELQRLPIASITLPLIVFVTSDRDNAFTLSKLKRISFDNVRVLVNPRVRVSRCIS